MAGLEISRAARRRVLIADSLPDTPPPGITEIHRALDGLPEAADLCAEQRAAALVQTQQQINRLQAYQHDLAAAADTQGDARVLHAGTTGTLIAAATGQDPAAGSAIVNRATALRDLPATAAAFRTGDLSVRHVAAIVAEHERIDDFTGLEANLVRVGAATEPGELRRLLRQLADNSGADDDFEQLREKRGLSLTRLPSGNFRIAGVLDPIAGEALSEALASRMDRAEQPDSRSVTQRRADALSEIIEQAQANTRPLGVSGVSVLIDLDDLQHGHLVDGTALGEQLTHLLTCDPILNLIIGRTRDGIFRPLAVGRAHRRATPTQWQALIARDRGCIRCGKHPRHCHAHHIIGWASGGKTDLDNLALLCPRCHADLHLGHYRIDMHDGIPHITVVNKAPPRRRR